MKSLYIILYFLCAFSLFGNTNSDWGGNYATHEYFKAVENRNREIAQSLQDKGILIDGKVLTESDLNSYGFDIATASSMWRETGGGPVSSTLGIPLKDLMESKTFRTLQITIITIALILAVIMAHNSGRLYEEGVQWLVKAFPALFVLFFPFLIYAFAMGLSNLAGYFVGIGLNSSIGQEAQFRMSMVGSESTQLGNIYQKAHDRALNNMGLYFVTDDPNAQKEINLQLNTWLKDLQAKQILTDLGALPVEEIDESNLAQIQPQSFARFRQLANSMLTEYPKQSSGSVNILGNLQSNADNSYPNSKTKNKPFDPFSDDAFPTIRSTSSPLIYFEKYEPLAKAIRAGEYTSSNWLGKDKKKTLDEDDIEKFLERYEDGIYQTTLNWYTYSIFGPLMTTQFNHSNYVPAEIAQHRPTTAGILNKKHKEIGRITTEGTMGDKVASWLHSAAGSVAKHFMRLVMPLALWLFSLATEFSIFAMWLTVPLWFFKRTEKAFNSFISLLISSALYPAVLLGSVFIVDCLFAQLTRVFFNSTAAVTVAGVGATGWGASAAAGLASVIGGAASVPILALAAGGAAIGAIVGYIIFTAAYVVAVAIICMKVPTITRKLMNGQLPIADFAQSTIGGLLAGAGVGATVGAPALAKGATPLAKSASRGAVSAVDAGAAGLRSVANVAEKIGPKQVSQRVGKMKSQGTGVFAQKQGLAAYKRVKKIANSEGAQNLRNASRNITGGIKNATREVIAAAASGGDTGKYLMYRNVTNKELSPKQGGKSGFGALKGQRHAQHGVDDEDNIN